MFSFNRSACAPHMLSNGLNEQKPSEALHCFDLIVQRGQNQKVERSGFKLDLT
jgi:hypothetical protein